MSATITDIWKRKNLEIILVLGILLRVVTFSFLNPYNNDDHFQIVQHIFENNSVPSSTSYSQSYHPPLYYLFASIFLNFGGPKAVQSLSLLLSVATMIIFYLLIKHIKFIKPEFKIYCLLFPSLLPQFVMFSLYITNDVLAIFIGSLIFFQLYSYISKPYFLNLLLLSAYLGFGLLTKGTFISFIPGLILLIFIVNLRHKISFTRNILMLLIFTLVFSIMGSYKYAENLINYRNPFMHNVYVKPDILPKYQNFYERPIEEVKIKANSIPVLLNMNLLRLVRMPIDSASTRYSPLLMFYGTFWYQYIPESNFRGNLTDLKCMGSLIYILAILPTIVLFVGLFQILRKTYFRVSKTRDFRRELYGGISVILFVSNCILVLLLGIRFSGDTYIFQSRLFFPSFFALVILLNEGLGCGKYFRKLAKWDLIILNIMFILYFFFEYWLLLL